MRSTWASLSGVVAACVFILSGCSIGTTSHVQFAPAYGPHIKPLPIACPRPPIPRAVGFITTPVQVVPLFNGDWLVADGGAFNRFGSKVVEFGPTGKPIWAVVNGSMDFVHSAYPTTRGNILIADTNNNRVIEVDPRTCKIVFNTDDLGPGHGFLGRGRLNDGSQLLYPNDAKELPNGHYLISSRMTSTLFEINRHGHVYWKCHSFRNLQGRPDSLLRQHNPQRLPNGDTLISDSDHGRIVIVNRGCTRMVWEYTGIPPNGHQRIVWPRDATMMRNGDILIDDSLHNRCLEVNWQHNIIRKYYDLPQPYSCWPLPNGLVASGDSNTHGIVLWAPGAPQAQPVALIPPKPVPYPFGKVPKHLVNGGFETPASACLVQTCGEGQVRPRSKYYFPPSGGDFGWQEDDATSESLPPQVHPDFDFDTTVAHSGYSSGRISWNYPTPHAPLWWGQAVRVNQYRWYTLSGWIKTQNVRYCPACDFGVGSDRGDSAYFAAQLIRPGPWANPTLPSFPKISGTTTSRDGSGWIHQSMTFYVPQGVKVLAIQCILAGKGTVWFDDVRLHELGRRLEPGT